MELKGAKMLVKGNKREQINPLGFYHDHEIMVARATEIISVTALAKVLSCEALAAEARVSYKITYKVIYKAEDGGINCHEENHEGMHPVKSDALNPKSVLNLSVGVVSLEHSGVSALKARAAVEIKGYAVNEFSFETPNAPENVYTKNVPVTVENIEVIKESEIIATGDFDFKEGIEKILTYDTQIVLKSVAMATELCEIKGDSITYLTYVANGSLGHRTLVTPFETEILAPAVTPFSQSFCFAHAASTTLTLSNDNDMSSIKSEVVVTIKGFAINKQEVEIFADAYSPKKELEIGFDDAVVEDNACIAGVVEKFNGLVRLTENKPKIRTVAAVFAPSIGAISAINLDNLTVEGIMTIPVVYIDENDKFAFEAAEMPYRFVVSRDFGCKENISANATVVSLSARAKHNDEIEIFGELSIEVFASSERRVRFIERIAEVGEREQNDAAISLYIVKRGETLWDVAKALQSDEGTLLDLNPNINLPLGEGEKVLLYREL
jgi:hypothetical protein